MEKEYKYLPQVQAIVDRIEKNVQDKNMVQWAKNQLMTIDDNMKGNPGYSMMAEMQIKGLSALTDEKLIEQLNMEYNRYIDNNTEIIQGLA